MLGIPVIVKDNIDTTGMPTTAESLTLTWSTPPDAHIVKRLKAQGALIIAKANLSEWANHRGSSSSSSSSAVGGQTNMAYALDRNPCGSSAGSAVAAPADLATVAIGTETDGSIVCPSGQNGVVGLTPTLGLVSRTDIVAISSQQDTAGPIARRAIRSTMRKYDLDTVVAPTNSPAWKTDLDNGDDFLVSSSSPSAISGFPDITVPAGYSSGFPVGVSFIGRKWGEAKLRSLAYSREQATRVRRPPQFLATVPQQ